MRKETVAGVYARALLDAAVDRGMLDGVLEDAALLAGIIEREPEVRLFLEDPRLAVSLKRSVIVRSLEGKVSDLMLDFLCLTIEKRRQALLPEILERFFALHDESIGRSRGEITTAVEMSAEEISRWAAVLGARIGRELVLAGRVDPEILGGLVLRFDGWVADGSLKTDLERVRSRLSRLKFGSELVHED